MCVFLWTLCRPTFSVGLNLWTPHANPLMQKLLNSFAQQLPPENGGLSLVLFRKNKVVLEKKLSDKWRVFLCHLNAEGHSLLDYQIPSPVNLQK